MNRTPTDSRPTRLRRAVRELAQIALMALVIFAARSSLADHYKVPTGSMEHSVLPGDHVFVDKLAYGVRVPFTRCVLLDADVPARGEVVVFDSPEDGTRLLKRVVAVEGDWVSVRSGELFLAGRSTRIALAPGTKGPASISPIERVGEHVAKLNLAHGGGIDMVPTKVGPGQVLVMGDARGNSKDGRFFGMIEADSIYGKANAVIYRRGEGLVWKPL